MLRMEDDNEEEADRRKGWHHRIKGVALFCLLQRQTVCKGNMLETEKGETTWVGGKETSEDAFSPLPPHKGWTVMCLSRLKSVFNVCLCSFSKLKKNG